VPGPLHRTGAFLFFFVFIIIIIIIIIIVIVIIIIIKFQDRDSQCSTVFPGTYTRLALNSKILVLCFPSAVIEGMNHHCPTNSCS
jgi:heme/copper-type cytochrome/quinol oxidase subunit 2